MLSLSILLVSLFVLITAVVSDLRTLEVPDWINYAGIGAGLGIHTIYSLQGWTYLPTLSSIAGLLIGLALASLMFYTGQWGGGDAKLLMAMGALIGFEKNIFGFGAGFIVNLMIFGAVWGLVWSFGLGIKNSGKVWRTYLALRQKKAYLKLRWMTIISTALLLAACFIFKEVQLELFALAAFTYAMSQFTIFAKSVELTAMHKWVTPDKLTEGDWLVHAVKSGKTEVIPPKLGLEKKQVKILQKLYKEKKINKVLVKYGVPFTPSFLLAFVTTMIWGNFILLAVI